MEEDKKLQAEERAEPAEEIEELNTEPEAEAENQQTEAETETETASDVLAARTIMVDKGDIEKAEEDDSATEKDQSPEEETTEENQSPEEEHAAEEAQESAEENKTPELSEEDREIAERIRLRKIEAERKRKRLKRRLITGAAVLVTGITALILSFTSIFTVDSIEVRGNTHYTAEEIISIGHAVPGKNLIYHSDKGVITKYLISNPYIKSADVSRKLPSTLVITVSERTPLMALNYDDDYLILDNEGILLQKSRTKPKLTIVEGNVIKKIKLGQELGTTDEELMNRSVSLLKAMADNDLYFVKLDMTDKYTIKAYVYDTLIVKNDYQTLMENIENGKLHLVLDKLFSESIKRGTITFNDDGTSTFMPGF